MNADPSETAAKLVHFQVFAEGFDHLDYSQTPAVFSDIYSLSALAEKLVAADEKWAVVAPVPEDESEIEVHRFVSPKVKLPSAGTVGEQDLTAVIQQIQESVECAVAELGDYVQATLELTEPRAPGWNRSEVKLGFTHSVTLGRVLGGPKGQGDPPIGCWLPETECEACVFAYVLTWKVA